MENGAIEEIEHTADWALQVRGRNLEELFINAALGMASLIADVEVIEPSVERQVELAEFDAETLLVSWLSELLWFNEESDIVFVRFDIKELTSTRLKTTAWGGLATSQWKHIKAVTFHDLEIKRTNDGYQVTVVFDV